VRPVILVVDDDPRIRSVLERLLRTESWHVVTAEDGAAGLKTFGDTRPDLVLLDIMMPGLDGFEVCQRLKTDPSSRLTPVVLLTGLGDREDRVRGIDAGADDFLSKPFDRLELIARVRSLLRLKQYTDQLERAESVLFALARSIEGKDPYTEGHCERLSVYAAELGARIGLAEEDLICLRRAGLVHDLGKVAVPDSVLLKPGRLDDSERSIMQRHPVVGEEICKGLQSFGQVLPIIRHHHERFDGSGYPDGLSGDAIPTMARIMNVVDIFDALTTARPYRSAMHRERALEVMREEADRGWMDPHLLVEFKHMISDKPLFEGTGFGELMRKAS